MMQSTLVIIILICLVAAILLHESREYETSIPYELMFWMFISLTVFSLLITVLQ